MAGLLAKQQSGHFCYNPKLAGFPILIDINAMSL